MRPKDPGFKAKRAGMCVVVVLVMLISGLAVLAAPKAVAQDYIGGPYGGELRVALNSQPNSLNPLADGLNEPAEQIIDLLYDSLGRTDPYTFEIKPWMASGWTIDAADDSIISVRLRSGMSWHDGTPITLDDIVYTFGPSGYDIDYISSMTKDDANNSVIFDLDAPDSRFFSEVMLKKVVPSGFIATTSSNGCGPFMYVSQDSDSTTIAAFDDHFIARPYIETIIFTYYPYTETDFSADYPYFANFDPTMDPRWDGFYRAAYDLIMDKIDLIGWELSSVQTAANIEISGNNTNLIPNANTTVSGNSGLKQWYLGFNNAEDHILNNISIRKAISYAINKEGLAQYDISGGLETSDSFISKYNLPWYNTSIAYPSYDLSVARDFLNDAMIMDYDSDGYVEMPGPDPSKPWEDIGEISLTLFGPPLEDVTPYTMSTNIITWFEELGIKVELVNDTMDVHMPNILSDDFDMYLADETSAEFDPQYLTDLFHSENIATNKNLVNFQGKYKVDNYPLISYLNETISTVQLEHTNLVGDVVVTKNDAVAGAADYEISLETGIFTWKGTLDYANDTLNITYTYLPFDHLIGMAGGQMDSASRAKYVKDAQTVLADMVPAIPLFSYKVFNAYRTGLYIDWVEMVGGVANYWTFTSLKNEILGDTIVTLDAVKKSLTVGENVNLLLKVQDQDRGPIFDSHLAFTGEGTFGTPIYDDAGQQYTIPYTAPSTTYSRTITLRADAYTLGYVSDFDEMDITVHPITQNFDIEITRGAFTIESGNKTTVTVKVVDKASLDAIADANVVLTLSPTGLGGYLEELTGETSASGEFVTNFGANNVTVDTTFRITAYVTKDGYVDADKTTSIGVPMDKNIKPPVTPPDDDTNETEVDKGLLGLPAPSLITLIAVFSCMSVAYVSYRRKRN